MTTQNPCQDTETIDLELEVRRFAEMVQEFSKLKLQRDQLRQALEKLTDAIRQGPPAVIGYDPGGPSQKAFNHGWNSNADRLFAIMQEPAEEVEAPQTAAQPDPRELLERFERLACRKGEIFKQCQGKVWPEAESDEFTKLRDTTLPDLRKQLLALMVQGAAPSWREEVWRLERMASTAMNQSPSDMRNILEDLAERLSRMAAASIGQPVSDGLKALRTIESSAKTAKERLEKVAAPDSNIAYATEEFMLIAALARAATAPKNGG